MLLQQPRVRARQPILRQDADRLKQRRAHLVIQILRGQLPLSALCQAFAHLGRELRHASQREGLFKHVVSQARAWLASLSRNGMSRRRTDSAAGTSSGRIAATCTQPFAATLPSSHNVCHRRNSRNSRGRRASPQIRETARISSASIPSRCPPNRELQTRLPPPGARPPVQDPTDENQNYHAVRSARPRPRGMLARPNPRAFHRPPGGIVLRSAARAQATWRTLWLLRGSHTRANPAANGPRRTSPGTSTDFRLASKMPDAARLLFLSTPRLPRSRVKGSRNHRLE